MPSNREPKHHRKETPPSSAASSKAPSRRASLRKRMEAVERQRTNACEPAVLHEQAAPAKWLAWDRQQTRIVGRGATRAEATAAAAAGGEAEPVLENVARTRRRFADLYAGGDDLRQELLAEEGEPFTDTDVRALLDLSAEEVAERRAAGALLAVPVKGGGFLYPCWQFTEGGVLPGLPEVLKDLCLHNRHPLAQVRFFLGRNLRLEGETPLSTLRRGKVAEVRQAARAYGEHGAE